MIYQGLDSFFVAEIFIPLSLCLIILADLSMLCHCSCFCLL
jgi:hypothetical protein